MDPAQNVYEAEWLGDPHLRLFSGLSNYFSLGGGVPVRVRRVRQQQAKTKHSAHFPRRVKSKVRLLERMLERRIREDLTATNG